MPPRTVQVTAPSRLHFGLLSFGGEGRQFGGVGATIERPAVELVVRRNDRLKVRGPLAARADEFARRWAAFHKLPSEPAFHVEVTAAPREHAGLGVGTQLGLSVAAALNALFDMPPSSPAELALSVGRGLRSAVGTYGFVHGGLIAERGKLASEPLSPLDCRLELPAEWRFVLVCPREAKGLSGTAERRAFGTLPNVAPQITGRLIEELRERMLPAAAQARFDEFSESVYQFGRLAGMCFADKQGGPYNGPQLTALVETIRALGVRGVGQSSWGPTLFALLPDEPAATEFLRRLNDRCSSDNLETWVSAPNNHGARVHVAT
jgi:beta-ribofuranosylaminobenzene 5'-phosphate synthase